MDRAGSQQHLSELTEESQLQNLSEEPHEDSQSTDLAELYEDSQLTDLTEQNEDSRTQDPNEQSEDGIQRRPETSEQQASGGREGSVTPVSDSWGKTSTDFGDGNTSTLLPPEPSTSSYPDFLSSDTLEGIEDLTWGEGSAEIPELLEYEELPLSLWENNGTEWKFERAGLPVPKQTPSFHRDCCSSAIEETIKQSPLKIAKSSYVRGFMQKRRSSNVKGSEFTSPYVRMRKHKMALQKKKESKGFFKSRQHTAGSYDRCCGRLGRRSKALYNLYTTFCDEEKEADPGFFQEGSPTASGLFRACTIFSVLKKGRINVSNLLLTLHTMGILMTRADMHQALKCVAVDERGNLNFLEFLNVVSLTTPFAGTNALQKARQVFRKLKKDLVVVEDLEPTLECLGVTLSPTMIDQALGCIQITWEGQLNISDFLSAARDLQSTCDKAAYLNQYPMLNWRSFGDVSGIGYSELRWRGKCSADRQMLVHHIPMATFCSAEEAVAFTELQRQQNKPQKPVDLKRPSTASPPGPAEENKKKKGIIKWPRAHMSFGYRSQDTSFPLESTLCRKKHEDAPVQKAETENQSSEDFLCMLPRPNVTPKVNQTKKKRLSFANELPKRYSAEDSRVPTSTLLETGDKEGPEDTLAEQPSQGS
ncbi:uncharacterized protein LOC143826348 [Paroedura picta]|uniref:uncharacterized protein LOC143826348 n=1 Tax=Paroedura picta TaxID=143630 RepID=UPI00405748C7